MPHISPLWWVTLSLWFMTLLSITFITLNWAPNHSISLETANKAPLPSSEWQWH